MVYNFLNLYKDFNEDTFLSEAIKKFYYYSVNYYKDNLDKRTIILFIRNLEGFEKFLFFQYPNIKNIKEIEEEHILAFRDFCKDGLNNSNKTINYKITSLKYFFDYLANNEKIIPYNKVLNIKNLRLKTIESNTPNIISSSNLKILFEEMRNSIYGCRDITISKLILTTGIDIEIILKLKESDLDIINKTITICGEIYPLSDNTIKDLREYLNLRYTLNTNNSNYLFLNKYGTNYTSRSYQLFFRKAVVNCPNIPNETTPRNLKATFIYNMAKVVEENELKEITNQNKVDHYYSFLKNPLQDII